VTARDRDGREIVDIWTLPLDETKCSRLLEELVLAVGLHSRMEEVIPGYSNEVRVQLTQPLINKETRMDGNYVFLCGVMWCRFGQQDAGKELLRAADSRDPDMKALARAMFAKGVRRLRELEKRAQPFSRAIVGENHVNETTRCL
jgi:hypothetical protein